MVRILWLVGMPGAGKTTLGRQLGIRYVDTDDLILKTTGAKDLSLVVQQATTDDAFYALEGRVVEQLANDLNKDLNKDEHDRSPIVVATGGSAVHSPRAVAAMQTTPNSMIVWIRATHDDLLRRCGGVVGMRARGVVLDEHENMHELLRKRRPLYAAVAHRQINTSERGLAACCASLKEMLSI